MVRLKIFKYCINIIVTGIIQELTKNSNHIHGDNDILLWYNYETRLYTIETRSHAMYGFLVEMKSIK